MIGGDLDLTLSGQHVELTRGQVTKAIEDVSPEAPHPHVVVVNDQTYAMKEAVARATGLNRLDFISAGAGASSDPWASGSYASTVNMVTGVTT